MAVDLGYVPLRFYSLLSTLITVSVHRIAVNSSFACFDYQLLWSLLRTSRSYSNSSIGTTTLTLRLQDRGVISEMSKPDLRLGVLSLSLSLFPPVASSFDWRSSIMSTSSTGITGRQLIRATMDFIDCLASMRDSTGERLPLQGLVSCKGQSYLTCPVQANEL